MALDFSEENGETLVVTTSDHANANPGLTLYAGKGDRAFDTLVEGRVSIEQMLSKMGRDPERNVRVLEAMLGLHRKVKLTDRERSAIADAMHDRPCDAFRPNDGIIGVLGAVLANHCGVSYCSPNHTTDHVLLSASGPYSGELPMMGHITDLHAYLVRMLGLPA